MRAFQIWTLLLVLLSGACRGKSTEAAANAKDDAAAGAKGEAKEPDAKGNGKGEALVLTPEQVRSAGIATAAVEERLESMPIQATATIEPTGNGQARIGPRVAGRIVALRAQPGDRVREGQVLALIDAPELGRARADYLSAAAAAKVAREGADREKALFEKKISAEREWREAEAQAVRARAEKEAAENRLHALGITDEELPAMRVEGHLGSTLAAVSPIAGVVAERTGTLGQMVDPQATLFVVLDLRRVWLQVDVYEQDLAQVRRGQKAVVRVKAAPGREFSGTVDNVGAVVDPKSRTVRVRVVLENPEDVLKPGMFATVTIEGTSGEKRRGLYVPSASIQRLGADRVVFLARGENAFEPRRVEIGREGAERTEIARGLVEGDRVVTRGAFALKSELKKDELGGEE
jgi:cobalt-zinc-cadmium efflux system membrane fusion protein